MYTITSSNNESGVRNQDRGKRKIELLINNIQLESFLVIWFSLLISDFAEGMC